MTFVALQSYRLVLKWGYHWRTAGLKGVCSEVLQKAKFLWPVWKVLGLGSTCRMGTMGTVVHYFCAGCAQGTWSSFACVDGWENTKVVLYITGTLHGEAGGERLMSPPRQSETVWLLRVCSVAWADVIAPSCPRRRIYPPTFLPGMSLHPHWTWHSSDSVWNWFVLLIWQRTLFVPG